MVSAPSVNQMMQMLEAARLHHEATGRATIHPHLY